VFAVPELAIPPLALQELQAKASGTPQARLFILSAPSGTGKDRVIALLRERGVDLHVVVTCTTRARRPHEVDGVDYRFIDEAEFLAMRARGDLLEDVRYADHYYGVPAQPVRDAVSRGQDVLLKIEVRGASVVKLKVPGAVLIFLAPPSVAALMERLRAAQAERGQITDEEMGRRLGEAQRELACIPGYDYVVVNHVGRIEEAVTQIQQIIAAEHCRASVPAVCI
jgi:guanylate kinase